MGKKIRTIHASNILMMNHQTLALPILGEPDSNRQLNEQVSVAPFCHGSNCGKINKNPPSRLSQGFHYVHFTG